MNSCCSWSAIVAGSSAVAYAGLLSVGVAFTLQIICQKHCPPGPTAVIMGMEAVFAAIAGYLVLDQGLTARAMVGCILIICGILTVNLVPIVMRRVDHDRKRRLTTDGITIDKGVG